MDRLTAMQVFSEVAISGSFSATADKLEMSRAMVTRYVSELEQWLGVRLLQRSTRRVSLTDAGENCLRRSQQMLSLMADIEEESEQRSGELRGQLRISCSMSFCHAHLAAAVSDFLNLHPQLKIDLHVSDSAVNLLEARIDVAIRISSAPDPMLIARPLAACLSSLVAAPQYLAQAGMPSHPSELTQHRCLSYANFGKSVWRFEKASEVLEVAVRSHLSANEATALMHAALAGAGIALQPNYLVNAMLADGRLTKVFPDWNVPSMSLYALYPSRRHLSPAVRALLDFLVERFAQPSWEQ